MSIGQVLLDVGEMLFFLSHS